MRNLENVRLKCHLGNILKEQGISALRLSKDIKYRRSTINDLINNTDMDKRRIPAQLIAKLCVYLDKEPNDLFSIEYVSDKPK